MVLCIGGPPFTAGTNAYVSGFSLVYEAYHDVGFSLLMAKAAVQEAS